jgi:hypothetical protein
MLEDFEKYTPILVGFIFDFSHLMPKHDINLIKKSLIYALERCTEPEDKAYLFYPENERVPVDRGVTISEIVTHNRQDFDLGLALKQTLYVLGCEIDDYRKYIFTFTDSYDKKLDYDCQKIFGLNKRENFDCSFVFCIVGEHNQSLEAVCNEEAVFWHTKPDEFSKKIEQYIKGLTGKADGENVSEEEY